MKGSSTRRSKRSLPQRSQKRINVQETRRELCDRALERAGHQCETRAWGAMDVAERSWPDCSGPLDVDEIIARSGWPGGFLVYENTQVLCRAHHDWKHSNPRAAIALGLTQPSWRRPLPGNDINLRIWE